MAYLVAGWGIAELARHMGVTESTITRLGKKRDEVGELLAASNRPGQGSKTIVMLGDIMRIVRLLFLSAKTMQLGLRPSRKIIHKAL